MTPRHLVDRNARIRRRRARGASLRSLARDYRLSVARVRQILVDVGGDPLHDAAGDIARLNPDELAREATRLRDRIESDRQRLRMIEDELDVRRIDRVLGLTG